MRKEQQHTPNRWRLSWGDPRTRGLVYQFLLVAIVVWAVWFLVSNTLSNLAARNISTGFAFLDREAGFAVSESLIAYAPEHSYAQVVLVGILNTLKVSVLGVVFATIFGTLIGIARLSPNWLLAQLARWYVEIIRNVPLLLQLLFLYALVTESLPRPRDAWHPIAGVFLSNRGIALPSLNEHSMWWLWGGLSVAVISVVVLGQWAHRRQRLSGKHFPFLRCAALLLVVVPMLAVLFSGPVSLSLPTLRGFNFVGGTTLSPEFFTLLVGLVVYTSAFVAEVVRSGIQAVDKGQWEAAASIGLSRTNTLRFVVLPQALRVIIPPMTSQYLNLTKNSSLAIAIGYPDIVSVVNTSINQTGQAIEGILIIMAVYLSVSLSISVLMNWYNKRMALVER